MLQVLQTRMFVHLFVENMSTKKQKGWPRPVELLGWSRKACMFQISNVDIDRNMRRLRNPSTCEQFTNFQSRLRRAHRQPSQLINVYNRQERLGVLLWAWWSCLGPSWPSCSSSTQAGEGERGRRRRSWSSTGRPAWTQTPRCAVSGWSRRSSTSLPRSARSRLSRCTTSSRGRSSGRWSLVLCILFITLISWAGGAWILPRSLCQCAQ